MKVYKCDQDSNDLPDQLTTDFSTSFTVADLCVAPTVTIGSVQGSGDATPVGGQSSTVRGVVVGDYEDSDLCLKLRGRGGLCYYDGANLNALLGVLRPGDLGFDIMHLNLHKTFSTPHGGGGPGSGPVGVCQRLVDYLPDPVVAIIEPGTDEMPPLYGYAHPARSIGRVKSYNGHFGILVRAYTYIAMHGKNGLANIAEKAVLNANYLLAKLKDSYHLPYDRRCMHEFVVEGQWADAPGIRAIDIAKRLIDYNFHPPTNYFPLIVHEALMIEPTETESLETLDAFVDAMLKIAAEARENPQLLHEAPHNSPVGRCDEVRAAKQLILRAPKA